MGVKVFIVVVVVNVVATDTVVVIDVFISFFVVDVAVFVALAVLEVVAFCESPYSTVKSFVACASW